MERTYRLGVDLGGTKVEAALLDPDGHIVARERTPTPRGDYEGTLQAVGRVAAAVEQTQGLRQLPLGIGTPGSPSPRDGLMRNANSQCLNGQKLADDLAHALDRPVRLANDANCLVLSEAVDGAAADYDTVWGVILGTGVGGGLVFRKTLLEGRNAIAGEWGHMPLPWPRDDERPGTRCYCGASGCLETFLSGTAVERMAREKNIPITRATDIERVPEASGLLQDWYDRLARSFAVVMNLIDPDVIVVGGGLNKLKTLYTEVPKRIPAYVFSDSCETPILPALHGDSSGVRGAARLW